jgi:hypothetical protein
VKFVNATELDWKPAGERIARRLSTNKASLQASELLLRLCDMPGCDDDVLDFKGAFVLLSPGNCCL